jgi:hypothetical protein
MPADMALTHHTKVHAAIGKPHHVSAANGPGDFEFRVPGRQTEAPPISASAM